MTPDIHLSINGSTPVSAASVGWSLGPFVRRNQQPDEWTLSRLSEAGYFTHNIASGDRVVFWLNGTRIFTGTAQDPNLRINPDADSVSFSILGPWWDLSNTTFLRTMSPTVGGRSGYHTPTLGTSFIVTIPPGDGTVRVWNPSLFDGFGGWEVPPGSETTYRWGRQTQTAIDGSRFVDTSAVTSTHGTLCGYDTSTPGVVVLLSVQEELWGVLEVSRLSRVSLGLPALWALESMEDFLDAFGDLIFLPKRTHTDRKISELVSELLMCRPDAVVYWDYAPEVPVFKVRLNGGLPSLYMTVGSPNVQSIDVSVMYSLRPKGVVVRWESSALEYGTTRGYRTLLNIDKAPADVLMHEPGVLCHTLLYDFVSAPVVRGLAASIYASLSTLRGSGTLVFRDLSPATALAMVPGTTVLLGGRPALDEAQLLIQELNWNPSTGQVQARLGYPRQHQLSTLLDMRTFLQRCLTGRLDE